MLGHWSCICVIVSQFILAFQDTTITQRIFPMIKVNCLLPLLFLSFTLGHILRSEDTDTDKPYILSDGSLYRDIATVETAKKAEMVTLQFLI